MAISSNARFTPLSRAASLRVRATRKSFKSGFSRNHSRMCFTIVVLSQLRSPRARLFLAATILANSTCGSRRGDPSVRIWVKIWPTISRALGLPRRREKGMTCALVSDQILPAILVAGLAARFGGALVGSCVFVPRGANRASRSSTLRTWPLVQKTCPSAVGTPRSVRAAAIPWGLGMPLACISAMMGASAKARAFARAIPVLRPAAAASGVAPGLRRGLAEGPFDFSKCRS